MEKYVIEGGCELNGYVDISCSKNAVLPIMAGSILTDEQVIIKNCPNILDVFSMVDILRSVNTSVTFTKDNDLIISAKNIKNNIIGSSLSGKLRSSIYMLGALLCRFKKVKIYYPGGCNIGKRPIDIHISALKSLGVIFNENEEYIDCFVDKYIGGECTLCFPSVGATENIILYSILAKGTTIIYNAAKEPEVIDLANMLNRMGAKINGAGTKKIIIEGVRKLRGVCYTPILDRIETGTFILATAICGGKVKIKGCDLQNISPLVNKICKSTCKVYVNNGIINVNGGGVKKPISFTTGPYPLFPTDLMAQTLVLCAVAEGESFIRENVFEDRFHFVDGLKCLGANVTVKGNIAIIKGVKQLSGASVNAEDLRGGAALSLAGLVARGQTVVNNVQHIERGYVSFVEKLQGLGARINKITEE